MRSNCINSTFLLLVVNLSLEIDLIAPISYMTWKVLAFDATFRLFGDLSLWMRFQLYY